MLADAEPWRFLGVGANISTLRLLYEPILTKNILTQNLFLVRIYCSWFPRVQPNLETVILLTSSIFLLECLRSTLKYMPFYMRFLKSYYFMTLSYLALFF